MPAATSIFLVLSLVLAVMLGPQTRAWTWGPAMFALGLAVLSALPSFWKRGKAPADWGTMTWAAITVAWFAWRAWISPVAELGQADLLLLAGAVGAFVCARSISGNATAERILIWGVALLLLANLVVIGMQIQDPSFSPVFRSRNVELPTGFFAHYNQTACYLIASSMLVGAMALFGNHRLATRLLWGLLAAAGIAGVWFTRSRGGILGAAVALGVFATVLLILAKRRDAKWFAPALIAIPIVGLALGALLFMGWQSAQEARGFITGNSTILDNNARLFLLGIALSSISLHPMLGGGSRSFSWECFRFVDGKAQGDTITHRPEFVHNELVQSATDYGLIGAGLLIGLLATLALASFLRVLFEERPREPDFRDAWRLGMIACLAGVLVQSNFSFVFHLLPGVLLIGICLGFLSLSPTQSPGPKTLGTRALLSLAATSSVVLLLPMGWKGIQVTRILWPTHFSKTPATSDESRIDALTEALQIWPLADFYKERANLFQSIAGSSDDASFREAAERAITDYQEASRLHPFDPCFAVNRANLLSQLQQDADAEVAFANAIELQGGMEPGYRAHFSLATHYLRKGLRKFNDDNPAPSLAALELSAEQIELAVNQMHWVIADLRPPRISIHESLGTAREAAGDRVGALEAYDFAATIPTGRRAHYRAGVLIGKMAVDTWSKRQPAEALWLFTEARKRVSQAGKELPEGVTPSQRIEYIAYLDKTIRFLKGAKVTPKQPDR